MVDLLAEGPTPHQSPTLTELEEARAYIQISNQHAIEAMMASEDIADVEVLLADIVDRPTGVAPGGGLWWSRPGPVLP